MTGIEGAFRSLVADLRRCDVEFALVGGWAVSARAEPRLTVDIDIAAAVDDDEQAATLIAAMTGLGYRPGAVTEQDVTGRLATVRLTHRDRPHLVIDMLFASCGIEQEIVADAEPLEVLPGLVVPVARSGHLIAMKLLARDDRERPTDYDDLLSLIATAGADELARAEAAVGLITDRGANRDRDLLAALATIIRTER